MRVFYLLPAVVSLILGAFNPALSNPLSNGDCDYASGANNSGGIIERQQVAGIMTNMCSREVVIGNLSGVPIYYDFDAHDDYRVGIGVYTTWTINSNASQHIVSFDEDLVEPGYQRRQITVQNGDRVVFKRNLDNRTINLFYE
jgi:hypothetical protein